MTEEQKILEKLDRCKEDLKNTDSKYRIRDLMKYQRRLENDLKKIRRKRGYQK